MGAQGSMTQEGWGHRGSSVPATWAGVPASHSPSQVGECPTLSQFVGAVPLPWACVGGRCHASSTRPERRGIQFVRFQPRAGCHHLRSWPLRDCRSLVDSKETKATSTAAALPLGRLTCSGGPDVAPWWRLGGARALSWVIAFARWGHQA